MRIQSRFEVSRVQSPGHALKTGHQWRPPQCGASRQRKLQACSEPVDHAGVSGVLHWSMSNAPRYEQRYFRNHSPDATPQSLVIGGELCVADVPPERIDRELNQADLAGDVNAERKDAPQQLACIHCEPLRFISTKAHMCQA